MSALPTSAHEGGGGEDIAQLDFTRRPRVGRPFLNLRAAVWAPRILFSLLKIRLQ